MVANKDKPLPTRIISTPLPQLTDQQAKILLQRKYRMKLTITAEETKSVIADHVKERGLDITTHTVLADGSHEIEVKFAEPDWMLQHTAEPISDAKAESIANAANAFNPNGVLDLATKVTP